MMLVIGRRGGGLAGDWRGRRDDIANQVARQGAGLRSRRGAHAFHRASPRVRPCAPMRPGSFRPQCFACTYLWIDRCFYFRFAPATENITTPLVFYNDGIDCRL